MEAEGARGLPRSWSCHSLLWWTSGDSCHSHASSLGQATPQAEDGRDSLEEHCQGPETPSFLCGSRRGPQSLKGECVSKTLRVAAGWWDCSSPWAPLLALPGRAREQQITGLYTLGCELPPRPVFPFTRGSGLSWPQPVVCDKALRCLGSIQMSRRVDYMTDYCFLRDLETGCPVSRSWRCMFLPRPVHGACR